MPNRLLAGVERLARHPLAQMIAVAAVTCALYAGSLNVGFFNDDPTGHFRWMEDRSLVALFTSASGYPFYRPLTFALWKVLYALLGGYDPAGFHLLNVLFHAMNAALLWALGYVLTRRRTYAMLAGLLFACFPFSYEAVAYAGALFHPLITFLILATLLLYHESKRRQSTALFGAAHAVLVLALFTHENGVIAPMLILGWEFLDWARGRPFSCAQDRPFDCAQDRGCISAWGQDVGKAHFDLSLPPPPCGGHPLPSPQRGGKGAGRMGEVSEARTQQQLAPKLKYTQDRPFNRRAWTFLVESALFFWLWLVIPRLPHQGPLFQPLSAMRVSALLFFQAIVHPVAPLALPLAARLGVSRDLALVVVGLGGLSLAYLIAHRARTRALFILALGWALLAALPAVLFLESEYVRGSPRLYYLTSVGTSLLWATVGLGLARLVEGRSRWLRGGIYLSVVVLVLALLRFDVDFVLCRQHFYVRATELLRMVSRAAATAPAGEELVYVNLPLYFSSAGVEHEECANPFPFGPSGAMAFPRYANVTDFIFVNGGPRRPAIGVTATAFAPGWATYGDPVTLEQVRYFLVEDYVYLCDLAAWRIFDLSAHWRVGPTADVPGEDWATFGEHIALAGYDVQHEGDLLRVTLNWHCLAAPEQSYTVFVHLYGPAAGPPVAQQDGPPAYNYVPTTFWQAGDRIYDEKTIALPAGLPPGDYTLVVGLYDPATGERLPAVGPDGQRYPNDAAILYQHTLP